MKNVILILFSIFCFGLGAQEMEDLDNIEIDGSGLDYLGGMTGGGGDLLNPKPLEVSDVKGYLFEVRDVIRAHFNKMEFDALFEYGSQYENMGDDDRNLDELLFKGPKKIQQYIEEVGLFVDALNPCYDANGKEKDASIHSPVPGTICISAKRLAPKLNFLNARYYLTVLLAHEYSHLVGTSEKEAISIQDRFTTIVVVHDYRLEFHPIKDKSKQLLDNLYLRMKNAQYDYNNWEDKKVCRELMDLYEQTLEQFEFENELDIRRGNRLDQNFYSVLSVEQIKTLASGSIRYYLAMNGFCSLHPSNDQNFFLDNLEKIFGTNEQAYLSNDVSVFNWKNPTWEKIYLDMEIKRVRSKADLIVEVNSIAKMINEIEIHYLPIGWPDQYYITNEAR